MYPKWIIENNQFRLGSVEMHRDLAKNKGQIHGGGFWHIDKENRELYLYGRSVDFGSCSINLLRKVHRGRKVDEDLLEYRWFFSVLDDIENGEVSWEEV